MSRMYSAQTESGDKKGVSLTGLPDICPQCHERVAFSHLYTHYNGNINSEVGNKNVEIVFRCPNPKCFCVFIGLYEQKQQSYYLLTSIGPKIYIEKKFPTIINYISKDFLEIYNQALRAESDGLDQISGPGYRKALEFLIKDYLIKKINDSNMEDTIKKENLGVCIENRIHDANIREMAKRAAWLGNDETHYVREWGERDLQDLKQLINLTVHWMEAEAATDQLVRGMPRRP